MRIPIRPATRWRLGPGTGVVTQALIDAGIPPERIVSVEYDKGFCRLLRKRFPKVNVIHGDALDLDKALGEFARDPVLGRALRHPAAQSAEGEAAPYLEGVLDRLVPGGVVSQLSYSLTPPQEASPAGSRSTSRNG